MISTNADQEPMMKIEIENRMAPIMLDTGATYTSLSPSYASHLPKSGKYIKTIGFSGLTQMVPMTAPVRIKVNDSEIKIPILISDQTPVNLLGRDAICGLKLQMWCSPEGIYIEKARLKQMVMVMVGEAKTENLKTNIYCLGNIQEGVELTLGKWGRYIREQFDKSAAPEIEFHCTMRYDPSRDSRIEQEWLERTREQNVKLTSKSIILGPAGAALHVESNDFTKTWFKVENSVPHVTLYVNEGSQAQDLGPMLKEAAEKQWRDTENPYIFQTDDMRYLKILCTTEMVGIPQLIIEETEEDNLMSRTKELMLEMEKKLPSNLWSTNDTDVGLVKSANPIRVQEC